MTIKERHDAFRFYNRMALGVCDGLAEMHRKGFLHRDLKLSNVLVSSSSDMDIVVIDAISQSLFILKLLLPK